MAGQRNVKINIKFPSNSEVKSELQSLLNYMDKQNPTMSMKLDISSFNKSLAEMSKLLDGLKGKLGKFNILEKENVTGVKNTTKDLKDLSKQAESTRSDLAKVKLNLDGEGNTTSQINDYVDSLGKATQETMQWVEVTDEAGETIGKSFEVVKTSITESFAGVDKETNKLQSKLDKISLSKFADKDVIAEFQKHINSINTDTSVKEIEDLKASLKSLDDYYKGEQTKSNTSQSKIKAEQEYNDWWQKALKDRDLKEQEQQKKRDEWWQKSLKDRELKEERSAQKVTEAKIKAENDYITWWKKTLLDKDLAEQKSLEKQTANLDKLKNEMKTKLGNASASSLIDDKVITSLQSKLNSINTNTSEKEINELKNAINNLTSQERGIVRLQNSISSMTSRIAGLQGKYKNLVPTEELKKALIEVDNLKKALDTLKNGGNVQPTAISSVINKANDSMRVLTNNTKNASTAFRLGQKDAISLGDAIKTTMQKFGIFASTAMVVSELFKQFKLGVEYVKYLDTAFTDLSVTMSITENQFNNMTSQVQSLAKEMGTSSKNVMDIVRVYANATTTIDDILKKTKPSVELSNVSRMSGDEVTKTIQATINQFKMLEEEGSNVEIATTRIGDALVSVSQNMAYDFSDGVRQMVEAIKISGSVAETSGQSLESYIALMGSMIESTGRDGGELANAYKMIASRVLQIKELSEETGTTIEDMAKAEESLAKFGISIREGNGNLRNLDDILLDLSKSFKTMTDEEKSSTAEAVAGTRQRAVFMSMMESMTKQQDLYNIALSSTGALANANEKYVESFEGKMGSLKATTEALMLTFLDGAFMKGFIDVLTGGLSALNTFTNSMGLLPTIIVAVVGGMTVLNAKFRENSQIAMGLMSPAYAKMVTGLKNIDTTLQNNIVKLKSNIATLRDFSAIYQSAGVSTKGFGTQLFSLNAKLALTTVGLVATKVATIALQTALSMGLSLVITGLITLFTNLVDKMITTKKELKELNDATTQTVVDGAKAVSQAEDLLRKKQTLDIELSNTTDVEKRSELEKELLDVQKQLSQVLPESADGFSAEGDAISTNNGLIREQIELKKEQMELASLEFIQNNKNLGIELNSLDEKKKKYEEMKLAMQQGKEYEQSYTYKDQYSGKDITGTISQKVTTDELKKLNDEISNTSLKAQQAQTHISWLLKNGYSAKELNDMGFDTSSVESYIKSVNEATKSLEDNTNAKNDNAYTTMPDTSSITTSMATATKAYDEANAKAQEYWETLNKINEAGEITPDLVSELISKYPELADRVTDATAVQDFLNQKIQEQVDVQSQAYEIMIGDDANYYNAKILNNQEWLNSVRESLIAMGVSQTEAYNFDFSQFNTLNELKNGILNSFGSSIAEFLNQFVSVNSEGYNIDLGRFESAVQAKAFMLQQLMNEIAKINTAISKTNKNIQTAMNNINKYDSAVDSRGLEAEKSYIRNSQNLASLTQELEELNGAYEQINTSIGGWKVPTGGFGAGINSGYNGGGSLGSGGSGSGSGSGSSTTEKEVADLEDLTDRYYKYNDVLSDVNNLLELNQERQKNAHGKELQKLLREEIGLLTRKKDTLKALSEEYKKEAEQLKKSLSNQGVKFDDVGNIENYNQLLETMTKHANSLSGQAKEDAINGVKALEQAMKRYTDLANNEIPNVTQEWENMSNTIKDKSESMLEGVRNKLAEAIRKSREEEKKGKISALDQRIQDLRDEIKALEDEDEDKQTRLMKLQAEAEKWASDDSPLAKKKLKELREQIAELEKEITIDKKNDEIEALEKEKEEVNKSYEELLSDKEIYQEADRLLTEGHMDQMVALLESYGQDYSDVGHLLGKDFTEAFNEEIKNALDALDLLKNEKNNFETPDNTPNTPTPETKPSTTKPPTTKPPTTTPKPVGKGSKVKVSDISSAIYVDSYTGRGSGTWKGAGVSTSDSLYVVNDNNGRVALSRTNNISGAIGWIDKKKVSAFDTGGMTSGSGFAMLHDKERVLSAEQTKAFNKLVYEMLPQLKNIPTLFLDRFANNIPAMEGVANGGINTINNEWNITNNTPTDVKTMEKDLERVFKSELRKFGKLK